MVWEHASVKVLRHHLKRAELGPVVSISLIALASLAGALVLPLSYLGRVAPLSASREWLLLLVTTWLFLAGWALLYARLLRRVGGLSQSRAIYWAALCHTPLLLCLSLPIALYGSDYSNAVYANSPYGQIIFQPMAKGYLLLAPTLAQTLLLAVLKWRAALQVIPMTFVTLVAAWFRLWNLNWGLPAMYHGDEHHYVGKAIVMLGTGNFNPDYFQNPSLLIYLDYVLDRLLSPQVQAFHLLASYFNWGILDPRGDYLMDIGARGISALAGALTVVAIYLAGKELFRNRMPALFGAMVMAVSFLHVRDSHFATNDVLSTFLLSLCFLFTVRIYRKARWNDYVLAGILGGLATTTKYNAGLFAVGILVAHYLTEKRNGIQRSFFRRHSPLVTSAVAALAAYLIGTPYTLLDFPRFYYDFRTQLGFGAVLWTGQDNLPTPLLYLYALLQGFGAVPLILALLAIPLLIRWSWRSMAVMLSVPAVYLGFMFAQRLFFARFAIPALPFLSLMTGYTIWKGSQLADRPLIRSGLTVALVTATLAQPLIFSLRHDYLLGQDDTRAIAAVWIEKHIPPGARIASEIRTGLHTPFAWKGTGGPMPGTSIIHPEDPGDIAEVKSGRYQYLITGSWGYGEWLHEGHTSLANHPLYSYLDKVGKLLLVVRPGLNGTELPYDSEDTTTPFWHLFDRARPGPTVMVYQLPGKE